MRYLIMYVNSINSMFTTLFEQPQNVLTENTLFKRPPANYSAEYLEDNSTQTPVRISVNNTLSSQIKYNQSVSDNITSALSVNTTVEAYLSSALANLNNVYSMAKSASDTTTTGSARSDLNQTVQDALDQIDEIYQNATFDGNYIMRGGQVTIAAGTDGQQTSFSYGNLNRATLGIDNIDISTQSGADDAVSALEDAISALEIQHGTIQNDESMLQSRYDASSSALKSTENVLDSDYSRKFTQTAFENSLAVISNKFNYAIDIQANTLTSSAVSTVFDSLSKISETMKSQQEDAIKKQEETPQKDTKERTAPNTKQTTGNTLEITQNRTELPKIQSVHPEHSKKAKTEAKTIATSSSSSLYELLQTKESSDKSAPAKTPASSKASTTGK